MWRRAKLKRSSPGFIVPFTISVLHIKNALTRPKRPSGSQDSPNVFCANANVFEQDERCATIKPTHNVISETPVVNKPPRIGRDIDRSSNEK